MSEERRMLNQARLVALMGYAPKDLLHILPVVNSTNDYAKMLAEQGAPAGTVVLAEAQTAGRGRLGRSFQSSPGKGIYLSWLLRPQCPVSALMNLTCLVAVAVCDAMETVLHFCPEIKWINDLVFHGQKLAGILTEMSLEPGSGIVRHCIVGIGINCGQQTMDFSPELRDMAISLQMALGRPIDREELVAEILRQLHRLETFTPEEQQQAMTRYRHNCVTLGKTIQVHQADLCRQGKALDVNEDGSLLVDFGQGVESIHSGEVSVRGMRGYTP